jgi:uncharacterized LabA/DUF88 family protein
VKDRSKTVVLLIDWDNLQICHSRDAPGTEIDLNAVTALAQSYGTLVSARAYAEWNLQAERLSVYKAGIEPVFAPVMRPEGGTREGKSLADPVMVADGVDLLWTVAPDVFVLVTSDKDMIPLARIAKQRGAAVVVLGSDLTAIPLVEMSNVFITYRQLLRELDRTRELDAPSGRAPARERRGLHETRRPSPEPFGGRGPSVPPSRAPSRPAETVTPPTSQPVPTAAPPAPVASLPPVSASTAAAQEVGDGGGPVSAEGIARRRRRRGGRSRGSGTGAGADAVEAAAEATEAGQDEAREESRDAVVSEQRDAPTEPASVGPVGGVESPPDAGQPVVEETRPPRTRQPRTRRAVRAASTTPLSFSEFGAPPPPPATAPETSTASSIPDEPSPAASENNTSSAVESSPTEPLAVTTEPAAARNGSKDAPPEAPVTEEKPKPVRRRRTTTRAS